MNLRIVSLLFALMAIHATGVGQPPQSKMLRVVLVGSVEARAQKSEAVSLPQGTTLKTLMEHGRSFGATVWTMSAQGFVEVIRLPDMKRPRYSLALTMNEAKRTNKADVALEDGDIVIFDVWSDL